MRREKLIATPGDRYNRLTIIRELEPRISAAGNKMRIVLVRCDCGTVCKALLGNIRGKNPNKKSCGCLNSEMTAERNRTHGLTGTTPLYDNVYPAMLSRCTSESDPHWMDYGGRGITVCDEWLNDPAAFVSWGESHGWEAGLTIDRIDNNKGYSPDNCRFITQGEQNRNKRNNHWITFDGRTMLLVDWAAEIGVRYDTLYQRLYTLKWSTEDALTTPLIVGGNQWTRKRITKASGMSETSGDGS